VKTAVHLLGKPADFFGFKAIFSTSLLAKAVDTIKAAD
jgi:hypothetical protein